MECQEKIKGFLFGDFSGRVGRGFQAKHWKKHQYFLENLSLTIPFPVLSMSVDEKQIRAKSTLLSVFNLFY